MQRARPVRVGCRYLVHVGFLPGKSGEEGVVVVVVGGEVGEAVSRHSYRRGSRVAGVSAAVLQCGVREVDA